jgi:hypothetical protein
MLYYSYIKGKNMKNLKNQKISNIKKIFFEDDLKSLNILNLQKGEEIMIYLDIPKKFHKFLKLIIDGDEESVIEKRFVVSCNTEKKEIKILNSSSREFKIFSMYSQ